jgi:hypothetical protein
MNDLPTLSDLCDSTAGLVADPKLGHRLRRRDAYFARTSTADHNRPDETGGIAQFAARRAMFRESRRISAPPR